MSAGGFVGAWCAWLMLADAAAVVPAWKTAMAELMEQRASRPACRLVRQDERRGVRVFEGWRAAEIAATLDACADAFDAVWVELVDRVGADGRFYRGHARKSGAHYLWMQNNPSAAKQNSLRQWKKSEARMRQQWQEYCAAYEVRFPGTKPVGFDRWRRSGRAIWLEKGEAGLTQNTARGMRAVIDEHYAQAVEARQPCVGVAA